MVGVLETEVVGRQLRFQVDTNSVGSVTITLRLQPITGK